MRKASSAARAADAETARCARIDGSSNKKVTGDRSEELTAPVEFIIVKVKEAEYIAKDPQPTAITEGLKGCTLAKLTYDETTRAETWDVGRVRNVIALMAVGPDGQAQPSTHTIKWQIGLTGRGNIYDLNVSIDSCGPTREWLVVQSKKPQPPKKQPTKRKR